MLKTKNKENIFKGLGEKQHITYKNILNDCRFLIRWNRCQNKEKVHF